MKIMVWQDRRQAGQQLAQALGNYADQGVVVYALPRGGVVLGAEVAKALGAPLDLVITRKIGHPQNREYSIAAVAEDGALVCNEAEKANIDKAWLAGQVEVALAEARRRHQKYLTKPSALPKGKTAIVVDDGIATGLTMQAAVKHLQRQGAKAVVVAVPVAPPESVATLEGMGATVVALNIDTRFLGAVGSYYHEFPQVGDNEVIRLIRAAGG